MLIHRQKRHIVAVQTPILKTNKSIINKGVYKVVKKIGRWQGAGLLATTLLGTSVFILPQMTYQIAEHSAIWTWLFLTLAIIPVTFVFAKLAALFPHAAGPAYFVEKAFGATLGKSIGFIFLLIIPLGVPAAILMTTSFIDAIFDLNRFQLLIAAFSIVALLYILNVRGIQISARIQFAITLSILAIVFLLLVLSGATENKTNLELPIQYNSVSPILVAAGIAFWSFLGVEAMTHLSTEFENPKKDMLPAMLIGTVVVGLVYLICTYLVVILPNNAGIAMVPIFDQLVGGYGSYIIGGLGIAGGISTTNVYTASATRLMASFAESRVLPSVLAKTNQHNVPINALVLTLTLMSCTLTASYLLDQELEDLISWVNGAFVIIYSASMFAAFKLLSNKHFISITLSLVFCLMLGIGLGADLIYATVLFGSSLLIIRWHKKRRNTANSV